MYTRVGIRGLVPSKFPTIDAVRSQGVSYDSQASTRSFPTLLGYPHLQWQRVFATWLALPPLPPRKPARRVVNYRL